jgi:Tol biopolymer transport system component
VAQDEGQRSLWVRQVATSGNVQIVAPAPVEYGGLTFSRDADYVYYVAGEKQGFAALYRVPALGGGPPRKLIGEIDGPITFSPDGSRLAFVRGRVDLLVANADGTGAETLASRPRGEIWRQPAWSPDGNSIACGVYSPADNLWRLVEVSVKDGAQKPLSPRQWQRLSGMVWLPEGDGLLVSGRDPETRQPQIWLLNYPGGEPRRVTNDLSSYFGLSLTADGRTLVSVQGERLSNIWVAPGGAADLARRVTFEAGRDEGLTGLALTPEGRIVYATGAGGARDLWIVDEDGRNNRQLTANSRANHSPAVTPDGRHVVFVSDRAGRDQIWRTDTDGGNPVQLTDGPGAAGRPNCSPDGRWVVYQVSLENKDTIWKVSIEGGPPVQLTDVNSSRPTVSPDGRFVLCSYGAARPDSPIRLAVIPAEGGPPVRIIDAPSVTRSVVFRWTPDGARVVYIDRRERVSNLWAQPLDGGPSVQLTDFKSDQIFQFDWSRDGTRLALARGHDGSDVVLISDFR